MREEGGGGWEVLGTQQLVRLGKEPGTSGSTPEADGGEGEEATSGGKVSKWTGSAQEQAEIQQRLMDWRGSLHTARAESRNSLSEGVWMEDRKRAVLTRWAGKQFEHMGEVSADGKTMLLMPEEALFLMESSSLDLLWHGVPVSIQQAYSLLLGQGCSFQDYLVYAKLMLLGFKVVRHQGDMGFTRYEVQIGLDQYRARKRPRGGTASQPPAEQEGMANGAHREEINTASNRGLKRTHETLGQCAPKLPRLHSTKGKSNSTCIQQSHGSPVLGAEIKIEAVNSNQEIDQAAIFARSAQILADFRQQEQDLKPNVCDVCSISCSSWASLADHLAGARHAKQVRRARQAGKAAAASAVAVAAASRAVSAAASSTVVLAAAAASSTVMSAADSIVVSIAARTVSPAAASAVSPAASSAVSLAVGKHSDVPNCQILDNVGTGASKALPLAAISARTTAAQKPEILSSVEMKSNQENDVSSLVTKPAAISSSTTDTNIRLADRPSRAKILRGIPNAMSRTKKGKLLVLRRVERAELLPESLRTVADCTVSQHVGLDSFVRVQQEKPEEMRETMEGLSPRGPSRGFWPDKDSRDTESSRFGCHATVSQVHVMLEPARKDVNNPGSGFNRAEVVRWEQEVRAALGAQPDKLSTIAKQQEQPSSAQEDKLSSLLDKHSSSGEQEKPLQRDKLKAIQDVESMSHLDESTFKEDKQTSEPKHLLSLEEDKHSSEDDNLCSQEQEDKASFQGEGLSLKRDKRPVQGVTPSLLADGQSENDQRRVDDKSMSGPNEEDESTGGRNSEAGMKESQDSSSSSSSSSYSSNSRRSRSSSCSTSSETDSHDDVSAHEELRYMKFGPLASLWCYEGRVGPLIAPEMAETMAAVMARTQITPLPRKLFPRSASRPLRVSFDCYRGTGAQQFRKSQLSRPDYRIIVVDYVSAGLPDASQLAALEHAFPDQVPILFAVVNAGTVSFVSVDRINLPDMIECG